MNHRLIAYLTVVLLAMGTVPLSAMPRDVREETEDHYTGLFRQHVQAVETYMELVQEWSEEHAVPMHIALVLLTWADSPEETGVDRVTLLAQLDEARQGVLDDVSHEECERLLEAAEDAADSERYRSVLDCIKSLEGEMQECVDEA